VIEDYYQIPKRIKAVTKEEIEAVARALFAENIWGLGVLSDCDEAFALELQQQAAPLWAKIDQHVTQAKQSTKAS